VESDWFTQDRRRLVTVGLVGAAGTLTFGCKGGESGGAEDVSATEDLMREHGVLRRLLVIYRETARRLRTAGSTLDAAALGQATGLFRAFGEDYHEKSLEEARIFPEIRKAGGPAAGLVDSLIAQHDRGRAINAYVKSRCASGRLSAEDTAPVAAALESFARMYEAHAAIEDTIVFQAWKKALGKKRLDEAGEEFE
jgi:hemerythrin-like domain-containing protein